MERKKKQIVRPRRHGEEIDGEKLERQHRGLMGGSFSRFNRSSSLEGERVRDSLDLEEDMQEMKVDQKLLVAALDIGTTYSGYAFSFAHEQSGDTADPDRIHVNTWENEGGSRTYFKTPSCLLLHPNKTLHSFGHEAIEKYNSLTEDKQHHDWYFFWQFKMTLHQEEVCNT